MKKKLSGAGKLKDVDSPIRPIFLSGEPEKKGEEQLAPRNPLMIGRPKTAMNNF
jgi:hypothetical protein